MISDNVTIADSFNEYFVNVGKSLAQKITNLQMTRCHI